MKLLLLFTTLIFTTSTFALTEDYILNAHINLTSTKKVSKKTEICKKNSLSRSVETICKSSKKSTKYLNTCLVNTRNQENQTICLKAKNLTVTKILSCNQKSSDSTQELNCLRKIENRNKAKYTPNQNLCSGLTFEAEITCLKFNK